MPIGDIVVSDVDSGETVTATITLADPSTGAFTATDGATYTAPTWTVTGTVAEVNTALANLEFIPALNNDQDTTATVSIVDGLENGAVAVTGTITLNVTPLNDDPVIETGQAFKVRFDAANLDSVGIVDGSDVDTGDTHTWSITGGNDLGVFSMVGLTGELKVADNATLALGQSYALEITVVDFAGGSDVEPVTVDIVEPSVFAIAFTDVDPDDGPGFKEGTDVLIAKLVDGLSDNEIGVLDAGDLVITNQYPMDFVGTAFGDFTVTEHTVTSLFGASSQSVQVFAGPNQFRWDHAVDAWQFYYEQGGMVYITDQLFPDGTDTITAFVGSPSAPETQVAVSTSAPGDNAAIDVEIYVP